MALEDITPFRYGIEYEVIFLTQDLFAIVDPADVPELRKHRWYANVRPRMIYAETHIKQPDGRLKTVRMHNLITGWPFVDHINHDGLDNRRVNLRESDKIRNARNSRSAIGSTSEFKGVSWYAAGGKWEACIYLPRKKYLGRFTTQEEAALAYNLEAQEAFGDHAHLNEIVIVTGENPELEARLDAMVATRRAA